MWYWSRPVLVGRREWRLVNVSGKPLTVEAVKSFDGVSKPFLVVEGGPHQTIPDGEAILVKFRATNLRNSFTGLILSGVDGAGLPWTVQYPVRS